MSLTSEASQTTYNTNGVTTAFPTGWKFFEASTVRCRYTPTGGSESVLVQGVDYTVSGGSGSTGTVTTTGGHTLAAGILVVEREVPLTQLVDFRTQGPFAPETHTEVADREMMAIQQLDRRLTVVEAGGGTTGGDFATRLSDLENSQATQDTAISGIQGDVTAVAAAEAALEAVVAGLSGVNISSATPQPLGSAAAGSTGDASDAGHVHAHGAQALGDGTNHALATEAVAGFASPELVQKVNGAFAEQVHIIDYRTTDATPTQVLSYTPADGTIERVMVEAICVDAIGFGGQAGHIGAVDGLVPDDVYIDYTGDGTTTQYEFPWWTDKASGLEVVVNNVTMSLGTDYSVTLPTGSTYGHVTLSVAPTNGYSIEIRQSSYAPIAIVARSGGSTQVAAEAPYVNAIRPGRDFAILIDASSPQVRVRVRGGNYAVRWRIVLRRLVVALA